MLMNLKLYEAHFNILLLLLPVDQYPIHDSMYQALTHLPVLHPLESQIVDFSHSSA